MNGNTAFYQVAIALIPGLLFGGATLQLREESPALPKSTLARAGIVLLLVGGLLAEVFAIRGAIDPSISDLEKRWIVFVFTTGTAGVAYWCAAPLFGDGRDRSLFYWTKPTFVTLLIGGAVLGQLAITESLHRAEVRASYEELSEEHLRMLQEVQAAEGADATARARLITLTRSSEASDELLPFVLEQLDQLDNRALTLSRDEDLDKLASQVDTAFVELNKVDDRLERRFEEVPDLSAAERELLLLAGRRVISAVADEMTSYSNWTQIKVFLENTCENAEFLGCSYGR